MKTGAIIQARMSSTRLPGKVMMELPFGSGITVLEQVVNRVQKSENIDQVIIATSVSEEDNSIVDLAKEKGIDYFRGDLYNVLGRFFETAVEFQLDRVVRITSDCPCIDPIIIDQLIDLHEKSNADFSSTAIERTFPIGMDASVFNFRSLEDANKLARFEYEKEHVTSFFYKTYPEKYKISVLKAEADSQNPEIRVTLDTKEDYILLCSVYDYLYKQNSYFGLQQILNLFDQKPWLVEINKDIGQKKVHTDIHSELNEVLNFCDVQDLSRIKNILNKINLKS